MIFFKKTQSKLKRLKRDESGSMAVAWALSIGVMATVIGAALDLAVLQNADARSQSLADTTALAAAVFIRNHERPPHDREEGLIGEYRADELGYDFSGWVEGGASGVNITVAYDDVEREATVTVRGNTRPTVLQVIGSDLAFYSQSTVKYLETDFFDPASVVLVLDNSGSMHFDDIPLDADGNRVDGTQPRIDGLETSAKELMAMLDEHAGPQDPDGFAPAVLRTGMMAFSGSNANGQEDVSIDLTVNMDWGVISDPEIEAMDPEGATNSAPPLVEATEWLTGKGSTREPQVHEDENPGKTPLKFIIMMTDGQNTVGDEEWVARTGTENWRAWLQTGTETKYRDEEVSFEETNRQVVNAFVPDGNCAWEWGYNKQNYTYLNSYGNTNTWNTRWRVVCDVTTTGTRTESVPYEEPVYDWVYREQELEPLETGDWEEGEFDIDSNIKTRAQCDILHDEKVEIFTIAYALAPGDYRTNRWGIDNNRPGGADFIKSTTVENAAKARGILQYCATTDDHFITADDAASLSEAFERIGNDIIQEVIRISG